MERTVYLLVNQAIKEEEVEFESFQFDKDESCEPCQVVQS